MVLKNTFEHCGCGENAVSPQKVWYSYVEIKTRDMAAEFVGTRIDGYHNAATWSAVETGVFWGCAKLLTSSRSWKDVTLMHSLAGGFKRDLFSAIFGMFDWSTNICCSCACWLDLSPSARIRMMLLHREGAREKMKLRKNALLVLPFRLSHLIFASIWHETWDQTYKETTCRFHPQFQQSHLCKTSRSSIIACYYPMLNHSWPCLTMSIQLLETVHRSAVAWCYPASMSRQGWKLLVADRGSLPMDLLFD